MGRGDRRRGPQRRAEGRVRGRVRERVQGRPQGRPQGRTTRGGGGLVRELGSLDVGAVEGYADRLRDQLGGNPGLAGAASGLAGAASGLAGSSLARGLTSGGTEGSEEDFRDEVRERLDLMDERLRRLEDEVRQLREGEPGDVTETPGEPASETNP